MPRPAMLRRLKVDHPLAEGQGPASSPPRDRGRSIRRGLDKAAAAAQRINRWSSRDERPATDAEAAAGSPSVVMRDFSSARVRPEAANASPSGGEAASSGRTSGLTLYITGDTLARVRGWLGRDPNTFEHILFRALFGLARIGGRAGRAKDVPVPAWPAANPVAPNGYIRLDPRGECPQCPNSASRGAHFCQACGRQLSGTGAAPAMGAAAMPEAVPVPTAVLTLSSTTGTRTVVPVLSLPTEGPAAPARPATPAPAPAKALAETPSAAPARAAATTTPTAAPVRALADAAAAAPARAATTTPAAPPSKAAEASAASRASAAGDTPAAPPAKEGMDKPAVVQTGGKARSASLREPQNGSTRSARRPATSS